MALEKLNASATFLTFKILASRSYVFERILCGFQGMTRSSFAEFINVGDDPRPVCHDCSWISPPGCLRDMPIRSHSRSLSIQGLSLPRTSAVLYTGSTMSPTLNNSPQMASTSPGELLIVRKLNHFMDLHETYGWTLPDMAHR